MYVGLEEKNRIVSFVFGYEIGRSSKCDFTTLLKKHFEDKLSIKYDSSGWPGQIQKYTDKKGLSWIRVFKQEALEILASEEAGGLDEEAKKVFKKYILFLVDKIEAGTNYSFNQDWIDDWNIFCTSKNDWFKDFWTDEEYKVIKAITKEINKADFRNSQPLTATKELLKLKAKFTQKSNKV
jgi:hypothetical protein